MVEQLRRPTEQVEVFWFSEQPNGYVTDEDLNKVSPQKSVAESPCCSGLPAGGNSGIMVRSTRHVSPLEQAHYARRP
jgi:hypothetical protein